MPHLPGMARPPPKSMTTVRMARDFYQIVQWVIRFHRRIMVSHLLGEAIRLSVGSIPPDKSAASIVAAVGNRRIKFYGSMQILFADGESGLASEEVAQWLGAGRACSDGRAAPRAAQKTYPSN